MEATPVLRSRQQQLVEHRHGAPVEVLLRRFYTEEGLSQVEVAERLGVSRESVVRWMAQYGISTRDRRALAPA